jgi:uncharacterized protein YacL
MKNASRVMYIIGRIFNIIELVVLVLGVAAGIVMAVMPDLVVRAAQFYNIEMLDTLPEVQKAATECILSCIAGFVISLIVFIFATKSFKALKNDKPSQKLHITMIVFGAFNSIFYLLAGIFGVVAMNQTQPTTITEENNENKEN